MSDGQCMEGVRVGAVRTFTPDELGLLVPYGLRGPIAISVTAHVVRVEANAITLDVRPTNGR